MAIRFAAASALALAAALLVSSAARAQSFFSFYEMSPRQIVGMLQDDGYDLRGPMLRRGDVYVCDVVSLSGRPARLIIDARDGHIVNRYASTPRVRDWRDDDGRPAPRPPRDVAEDNDHDLPQPHRDQWALGDLFTPPSRVYGNDSLFGKPDPVPTPDAAPKPKRHVVKKHQNTNVAKTPTDGASPDAAADAPKPTDSSVAAVAPGAPEAKKPDADGVKPVSVPVETPKSEVAAPKPSPAQEKAEIDKRAAAPVAPTAPVKPKTEAPRKKINDLPVGTLD